MDAADTVFAVVAKVVEDDEGPVGPAAEDRVVELQRLDGRVDGHRPRVCDSMPALLRLVGEAVTPEVHRDEAVVLAEVELSCLLQVSQHCEVPCEEQNRAALGVARVSHEVELNASAASDVVDWLPCGVPRKRPGDGYVLGVLNPNPCPPTLWERGTASNESNRATVGGSHSTQTGPASGGMSARPLSESARRAPHCIRAAIRSANAAIVREGLRPLRG